MIVTSSISPLPGPPNVDSQPVDFSHRLPIVHSSAPIIVPSFLPPLASPSSHDIPSIPSTANPFLPHQPSQNHTRHPDACAAAIHRQILPKTNLLTTTPHVRFPTDCGSFNKIRLFDASQPASLSPVIPKTLSPSDSLSLIPAPLDLALRPSSFLTLDTTPKTTDHFPPNLSSQIQNSLPGSESAIEGSDFSGRPLRRNVKRLQDARNADVQLLGEFRLLPRPFPKYDDPKPYLPNDVPKIFPNRLFPPALRQESHPLSLDVIIAISQTEQDTPHDSPFCHDIHPDEVAVANAEFNSRLIDEYDMDMQRLLDAYPYSVISPGSEFRPAGVLEPLLAGHPYWPRLKSIISHGVSYPLTAVEDETARRAENDAILEYGNHASGKKNPEALTKSC